MYSRSLFWTICLFVLFAFCEAIYSGAKPGGRNVRRNNIFPITQHPLRETTAVRVNYFPKISRYLTHLRISH